MQEGSFLHRNAYRSHGSLSIPCRSSARGGAPGCSARKERVRRIAHARYTNRQLRYADWTPFQKPQATRSIFSDYRFDGLLYSGWSVHRGRGRYRIHHHATASRWLLVHHYKDIPEGGHNELYMIKKDYRCFAEGDVRYIGETIGLLVGPDRGVLLDLETASPSTMKKVIHPSLSKKGSHAQGRTFCRR